MPDIKIPKTSSALGYRQETNIPLSGSIKEMRNAKANIGKSVAGLSTAFASWQESSDKGHDKVLLSRYNREAEKRAIVISESILNDKNLKPSQYSTAFEEQYNASTNELKNTEMYVGLNADSLATIDLTQSNKQLPRVLAKGFAATRKNMQESYDATKEIIDKEINSDPYMAPNKYAEKVQASLDNYNTHVELGHFSKAPIAMKNAQQKIIKDAAFSRVDGMVQDMRSPNVDGVTAIETKVGSAIDFIKASSYLSIKEAKDLTTKIYSAADAQHKYRVQRSMEQQKNLDWARKDNSIRLTNAYNNKKEAIENKNISLKDKEYEIRSLNQDTTKLMGNLGHKFNPAARDKITKKIKKETADTYASTVHILTGNASTEAEFDDVTTELVKDVVSGKIDYTTGSEILKRVNTIKAEFSSKLSKVDKFNDNKIKIALGGDMLMAVSMKMSAGLSVDNKTLMDAMEKDKLYKLAMNYYNDQRFKYKLSPEQAYAATSIAYSGYGLENMNNAKAPTEEEIRENRANLDAETVQEQIDDVKKHNKHQLWLQEEKLRIRKLPVEERLLEVKALMKKEAANQRVNTSQPETNSNRASVTENKTTGIKPSTMVEDEFNNYREKLYGNTDSLED